MSLSTISRQPGETTYLEWNDEHPTLRDGGVVRDYALIEPLDLGNVSGLDLTVKPGQMCSGTLLGIYGYTFSVNAEGEACVDDRADLFDGCYSTSAARSCSSV